MKNRVINALFFVVGLGIFIYLISQFGLDQIFLNIHRAGWSLLGVIIVWLFIYMLNTLAWRLVLGDAGSNLSFIHLFMITVSGFTINYITPVVAIGGEPYKVRALTGALGADRSLSAVVLYRMVHLLGHMILLFVGIIAAILFLPLPQALVSALGIAASIILAVIAMTLLGHREGIFENLKKLLVRIPLLNRLGVKLEKYGSTLAEMDDLLTAVYRHDRAKFYYAIGCEFASRLLMGIEVYIVLRGVGVDTTIVSALFLYVVYSIIINILFFIPLNIGAREGGLYLGLESLAITPLLGVYLGIVMRLREFFWILVGLGFVLLNTEKRQADNPPV